VDPRDGFGLKFVDLNFWSLLEMETHFLGHPIRRLAPISSTFLWFLITICSLGTQDVTIECRRKGLERCLVPTVIVAALIFRVAITNLVIICTTLNM
jgi:hypothetical protein